MAKKEKDTSAASQKIRDAEKLVQQRQAQKAKGKKPFAFGKFFKDFRADAKKIIWPDTKTVLRNTGIVLLMVAIVGIVVFLIDTGLVGALRVLNNYAESVNPSTTAETTTEPLAAAFNMFSRLFLI